MEGKILSYPYYEIQETLQIYSLTTAIAKISNNDEELLDEILVKVSFHVQRKGTQVKVKARLV